VSAPARSIQNAIPPEASAPIIALKSTDRHA
jgi:hypothetical protein